jgi:hypothetical protein
MTAEATPSTVAINNMSLRCPTTGEFCPSRMEIARLCGVDYSEDMSPEELEFADAGSKVQPMLLMGHNQLINLNGCMVGPVEGQCPPSAMTAKEQPVMHGVKQLIKRMMTRTNE